MILPAGLPLLAYVAGALTGWTFPEWRDVFGWALLFCVPPALVAFLASGRPLWKSIPLLVCLLLLAALRTSLGLRPVLPRDHLVHQASGEPLRIEGVLYREPEIHAAFTRLAFEARALRSPEGATTAQGRAHLWVSGSAPDLRVGDILLVEARLRPPRGFGNPGEIDRRARAFLEGVHVKGSIQDARYLFRLGVAEGYGLERFVQRIRSHLAAFFEREKDPKVRGLLRVWFLGDRSGLTEPLADAFRSSGLAHLLAISGLHVGLVGLFVYRLLKSLLKRSVWILLMLTVEKLAVLGSLPFVLAYVLLVGSPITAVRAATMFVLFVGSLLLDRARAVWNSLALAGLLILVWDPAALFSVSFLLSFAAVAGLLAAASAWKPLPVRGSSKQNGAWSTGWQRAKAWAWRLFTASLAATIATAPLTAFFFHRINPLAVPINLVVVPVVGWLVIPFGLLTAGIALFSAPAAGPFLWVTSAGTRFVAAAAEACSEIPFAWLRVGRPSLLEMVLLYLTLFAWVGLRGSPWRKRVLGLCVILFCFSLTSSVIRNRWDPRLVITFLSVGQGDSILVEFPGGKRMIVDGGPARKGYHDAGRRVVAPFLGYRRICRIDYMVVSHGQADHYGGLSHVAEELRAAELWIGPEFGCEAGGYEGFLNLCRRKGIPIRRLCRGMEVPSINGVRVEVLNPPCDDPKGMLTPAGCSKALNDRSLVVRLTLGSVSVLLTGDVEEAAERELGTDPARLDALLLQAPHHGSAGSSSRSFLDAVDPRVVVVSAGYANRFGFPAASVLRRFRDKGILLYRTDLDGAVRCTTDGRTVWMETFRGRERSWVSSADPFAAGIEGRW